MHHSHLISLHMTIYFKNDRIIWNYSSFLPSVYPTMVNDQSSTEINVTTKRWHCLARSPSDNWPVISHCLGSHVTLVLWRDWSMIPLVPDQATCHCFWRQRRVAWLCWGEHGRYMVQRRVADSCRCVYVLMCPGIVTVCLTGLGPVHDEGQILYAQD